MSICLGLPAAGALAQVQLLPPPGSAGAASEKPKPVKPKVSSPSSPWPKKPARRGAGTPASSAPAAPAADDPNVDLVYGAYQRGQYKTAFDLATARAQNNDPKAMAMLGELYAGALGIKRDYAKAAEWYKRAADLGDREAMFALAMLRISGRGGPVNREEGARLLASSAKLGNPEGGL